MAEQALEQTNIFETFETISSIAELAMMYGLAEIVEDSNTFERASNAVRNSKDAIAAARDLHAACEDLIEVIGYAGLWPMFEKQINAAKAAIAKAQPQ